MSSDLIDFDFYDKAIINALRKHPEGIRYSQLGRESKINGKTFDSHLKYLVDIRAVDKTIKGRSKVFYKVHPTAIEERRRQKLEELIGRTLEGLRLLYEQRKILGQNEQGRARLQEHFDSLLSSESEMVKTYLILGLACRNSVEQSLIINEITEQIREYMTVVGRLIHENDEARDFFEPLLLEIMSSGLEKKEKQVAELRKSLLQM